MNKKINNVLQLSKSILRAQDILSEYSGIFTVSGNAPDYVQRETAINFSNLDGLRKKVNDAVKVAIKDYIKTKEQELESLLKESDNGKEKDNQSKNRTNEWSAGKDTVQKRR